MEEQSTIRKLIGRNVERQLVREYLLRETERAGFGGLTFNRTPEGTKISLRAEQVGRVIGRRGKVIHELSNRLKNDFSLDRPHLDVEEVTEPRLSAQIMASRLSSSLERGWFFRRAGHGTAQQIMDAGARGCLIVLSGKITGARHRVEKFQQGHIKFCGETALEFMDTGFSTAVKKLGTIGCTVKIMRPDAKLPHEIIITERADSGLPPLAEIAVFDASDEETVDELAAITEEAEPETDAEGVVDSVVDMMAGMEELSGGDSASGAVLRWNPNEWSESKFRENITADGSTPGLTWKCNLTEINQDSPVIILGPKNSPFSGILAIGKALGPREYKTGLTEGSEETWRVEVSLRSVSLNIESVQKILGADIEDIVQGPIYLEDEKFREIESAVGTISEEE